MSTLGKLTLCFPLLFSLSGCATYFERSAQRACFNNDWLELGFKASTHGQEYQRAWSNADSECERYNVWSDQNEFARGYQLGLEAFCQLGNGFEFGKRNRHYQPICEPVSQGEFDQGYTDGQQLYDQRHELDSAIKRLNETESFIEYAHHRRKELKKEIDSGQLDKRTEKKFVEERHDLKYSRFSALRNIAQYRSDAHEAESQTAELERRLNQEYYSGSLYEDAAYSVNEALVSENKLVAEAALLIYKPRRFIKSERSKLKQQINEITKHITTNHPRGMRFQVIRDEHLFLIASDGKETRLATEQTFGEFPQLLFWNPEQGLETHELQTQTPLPLAKLDAFINQHRVEGASKPLVVEFNKPIKQKAKFSKTHRCRRSDDPPDSVGTIECMGAFLVKSIRPSANSPEPGGNSLEPGGNSLEPEDKSPEPRHKGHKEE